MAAPDSLHGLTPASNPAPEANAAVSTAQNRESPVAPDLGYSHESDTQKVTYRCIGDIVEGSGQIWGVQFCRRPSQYQLMGNAYCWKKRFFERKLAIACAEQEQVPPRRVPASSIPPDEFDAPIKLSPGVKFGDKFATVSGPYVRCYNAVLGRSPDLFAEFIDCDPEEDFYCVTWLFNADNGRKWWVCAGGLNGVIRVIDVQNNKLEKSLLGHGDAVNDVKVHPRDPALIISASSDNSLLLWNLRTGTVVAGFFGFQGHRCDVLTVDFDTCGHKVVSGSLDNSVRIWNITDDDRVIDAIEKSHYAADLGVTDTYNSTDEKNVRRKMTAPVIQMPVYLSKSLHGDTVDCAMWIGNAILSKSVTSRMYLWLPGGDRESLASQGKGLKAIPFTILDEFEVKNCDRWYIRFGLDSNRRIAACGAERGAIYVYRLDQLPVEPMCVLHPKFKSRRISASYVRQCAFSDDGSIIVSVDDNSVITQYDCVRGPIMCTSDVMDE